MRYTTEGKIRCLFLQGETVVCTMLGVTALGADRLAGQNSSRSSSL